MDYSGLLNLLWHSGEALGRTFEGATGETVTVCAQGEPAEGTGVWLAAEVVVDGERRRGTVAVGARAYVPGEAVLRVVESETPPVLGLDDSLVPQIVLRPEADIVERYHTLLAGAPTCGCAERLSPLDPLRRLELFTGLVVERLRRKTARSEAILDGSEGDWNQTLHTLLLGAMGGDRNRDPFTAIARKATVAMLSREKSSLLRVEALLLGTAGFLHDGEESTGGDFRAVDDYTRALRDEFRHLAAKYSITPLHPADWNFRRLYPANHPAVRLAEVAALLCKKDFMLDGLLACRSSKEIEELMAATASPYWNTRYKPSGEESAPSVKSIGQAKARLVGINVAVPLMFAYGRRTGTEELCERSIDVLATIPAERNSLLDGWYRGGCRADSAFDSQALLELAGRYCATTECAACPVGRRVLMVRGAGLC